MIGVLRHNWWAILLRGILAIVFGLLVVFYPGAAIVALVILFGAYAAVDGVFAIISAVLAAEAHERWWPFILEGIAGLAIGAITFFRPETTALALYLLIAAWAIITGVLEIIAAIRVRLAIANEIWLLIGGICSIVFGILMIVFPMVGALALIWVIGSYAILFGILMIAFSLRVRAHAS